MRLVAAWLLLAVLIPSSLGFTPNGFTPIKPSTVTVAPRPLRSLLDTNANVKPLKGTAVSDPACCTAGVHLTYCFVRWENGFLHYRRVGTGEKWASMGRWIIGAPTCVAHGLDVTVIAVQGVVGNKPPVISNTIRGGKWIGFKLTGGYNAREAPGCVTDGSVVTCMYRGAKCGAYILTLAGGVWKPVRSAGGEQYSPIAGIHLPVAKQVNFYATNNAHHMSYYTLVTGGHAWRQAGTFVMYGRPSVCTTGPKIVDILAIGPGSNLLWCRRDAAGKYKWRNIGGPILYPPTCVGRPNNINCFAINLSYQLVRKIYVGGKWGPYTVVADGYIGTPSCHPSIAGVNIISCYVRNMKNGIDAFAFIA